MEYKVLSRPSNASKLQSDLNSHAAGQLPNAGGGAELTDLCVVVAATRSAGASK
jgi:hypothetical protein